jgi:hypothetical protein
VERNTHRWLQNDACSTVPAVVWLECMSVENTVDCLGFVLIGPLRGLKGCFVRSDKCCCCELEES